MSESTIVATTDRKAVNDILVMNGDRKRPIDDFFDGSFLS